MKSFIAVLLLSISTLAVERNHNFPDQGPTLPPTCDLGQVFHLTGSSAVVTKLCSATDTWSDAAAAALPSGVLVMVVSGSCPSGFTEVSALNGKMLRGTLAANGDVGTIGGNATITPAGTVSQPTFTGTASQPTSADSAGTPAGTTSWPAGVPTNANESAHTHSAGSFVNVATATSGNCAATNVLIGTGAANACKATAPNLTVPAEGHSGTTSAGSVHTHTVSWPAGVPAFAGSALGTHSHTLTPSGTISQPTFTGTPVDPSPAYTKVIFCSAN